MLTLAQIKASSRLRRIAGSCSDSSEFSDLVNDAVRMLVNRGNWYGTVKKIKTCVYSGCITWPREVATVLAINRCHNVQLSNHWFEFDPLNRTDLLAYWNGGCRSQLNGVQGNTSPVFNPINCADGLAGMYLHFFPSNPNDVGKTVTVYGIDSNGNELISNRDDGTVQPGIVVSLTLTYAALTITAPSRNVPTIRHITQIVKEVTKGPVYAYQTANGVDSYKDLAVWQADETNPSYQTTRLSGCFNSTCGPQTITGLVKLKFIPAVNDNDIVIIDNLDAIAMMAQTIKFGDAYDAKQKQEMEAEAVREMNLQLRNELPLDQIPVSIAAFGTALPSLHGIGKFS